jgi:hypothetical protein
MKRCAELSPIDRASTRVSARTDWMPTVVAIVSGKNIDRARLDALLAAGEPTVAGG